MMTQIKRSWVIFYFIGNFSIPPLLSSVVKLDFTKASESVRDAFL